MKNILLFFLMFGFSSCENDKIDDNRYRNENYGWFISEKTGIGEWVKLGGKKPDINGEYIVFFFNGNKRESGRIENEVHVDTTIIYNLKGEPIKYYFEDRDKEKNYFLKNGKYESYHPTGEIMHSGIVKDHKAALPWKSYSKEGTLLTHNYILNDSISIYVNYYSSGIKKDSISKLFDKNTGVAKLWYENGNLQHSSNWQEGKMDGIAKYFFPDGSIKEIKSWSNGKKVGLTVGFFKNGQTGYKYHYLDGQKFGVDTNFYEHGNIRATYNMEKGKRNGIAKIFYPNGKEYFRTNYRNDKLNGQLRRFGLDGSLRQIEFYSNGQRDSFKIISEFTDKERRKMQIIKSENAKYQNY